MLWCTISLLSWYRPGAKTLSLPAVLALPALRLLIICTMGMRRDTHLVMRDFGTLPIHMRSVNVVMWHYRACCALRGLGRRVINLAAPHLRLAWVCHFSA